MTEEQAIFQRSVRVFLEKEAAPLVAVAEDTRKFPVTFMRRLGELGYLCMRYGDDVGGAGADHVIECMLHEELARVCASFSAAALAHTAGSNAIYHFGSQAQREKYVVPAVRGEKIGAFSITEPNAGSDLAALQCRAIRDGDEYVVNGQKVWTTSAHHAHWGLLLARTDWDQTKHKGLSYFILDMHQPGVKVQPLKQMNGHASFNQVFMTDAEVQPEFLVANVGDGWAVTTTTLMHERRGADGLRTWAMGSDRKGRIYEIGRAHV